MYLMRIINTKEFIDASAKVEQFGTCKAEYTNRPLNPDWKKTDYQKDVRDRLFTVDVDQSCFTYGEVPPGSSDRLRELVESYCAHLKYILESEHGPKQVTQDFNAQLVQVQLAHAIAPLQTFTEKFKEVFDSLRSVDDQKTQLGTVQSLSEQLRSAPGEERTSLFNSRTTEVLSILAKIKDHLDSFVDQEVMKEVQDDIVLLQVQFAEQMENIIRAYMDEECAYAREKTQVESSASDWQSYCHTRMAQIDKDHAEAQAKLFEGEQNAKNSLIAIAEAIARYHEAVSLAIEGKEEMERQEGLRLQLGFDDENVETHLNAARQSCEDNVLVLQRQIGICTGIQTLVPERLTILIQEWTDKAQRVSEAMQQGQHLANDLYSAAYGALSLRDTYYCQLSSTLVTRIEALNEDIKIKEAIRKVDDLQKLRADKDACVNDNAELEEVYKACRKDIGLLEAWRKMYNVTHNPIRIALTEHGETREQYWYQPQVDEQGKYFDYQVLREKDIHLQNIFQIFFTFNEQTGVDDWAAKVALLRIEAKKLAAKAISNGDQEAFDDIRTLETIIINKAMGVEVAAAPSASVLPIKDQDKS